jgi:DNA polymerase IIIc chi subunit
MKTYTLRANDTTHQQPPLVLIAQAANQRQANELFLISLTALKSNMWYNTSFILDISIALLNIIERGDNITLTDQVGLSVQEAQWSNRVAVIV